MCQVCSHDSIYPLKWSEKWFSLRPITIFARNNRWQNRKLTHCRHFWWLQMQQQKCFIQCELWREEHHDKTKDTAGKPDPHSLLGKLMKVGNRCSKVWVGLWYISWFNIIYDILYVSRSYMQMFIWRLRTLMKCEGDIRKNRRITTSKSFEKSVQKTWKHHCWLCLWTHPSSQNSLSFLCQNNVDKGAGKVHRRQNGWQWNQGFWWRDIAQELRGDSEWL